MIPKNKAIAEEKMVELKKSLSDRLSTEAMTKIEQLFGDSKVIDRFKGKKGEKGDAGNAGEDGTDGLPGMPGMDGMDGESGKDGEKGTEGKQGERGSPDTVKQIATKLNSDREIVGMSVIKGLTEALKNIRALVRKKGGPSSGGMGTPIKFSFTGDGSTTEFTLPAVPSGNGLALWAYSDSAWLQPGIHYDVSQLKFTTTYTPENGAIIEGFLIP